MKICINLLAATAGGQITRSRAFLDRFKTFSGGAELIVVKERSALKDITTSPGRNVIDVSIRSGPFKAFHRTLWENAFLPSVIRQFSADVFLTFSHYVPSSVSRIIPSVVGVSNLAPFSREAWDVEGGLTKLKMMALRRSIIASCNCASHVIGLSGRCKEILVERGVPEQKISVIPNGVEASWGTFCDMTGLAGRLGVTRAPITYVSHFHRYKNHPNLIDAYSRIDISLRRHHQLVLVGQAYDSAFLAELIKMVNRLGLNDDVVFVPKLGFDELRELYRLSVLFVFPSLIENCPNILLEAMMAGLPVAASKCPPMPEFCGEAAVYFDPLDSLSITRVLEGLLADESLLAKYRAASNMRAKMYSWDQFVERVIDCCRLAV